MKTFIDFVNENVGYTSGIEEDPEKRGYIMYRKYEDGILVFMGSHVDNKFRGQGIFNKLLENLLSKQEKGTEVQVPLTKSFLVPFFKKYGFEVTEEPIRYWGNPENSTNVKKII